MPISWDTMLAEKQLYEFFYPPTFSRQVKEA
jgi:hypothetical protein